MTPLAPWRIAPGRTALVLLALLLHPGDASGGERLRMATTTSTENSGLLAVLLPPFERECGCRVDVVAVGTGKALKLAESGDVDVVLVHAPPLEERFVADGHGVDRRGVMYNDFVVVGPPDDPAGVRGSRSAAEAFRRIARATAPFVSRGDGSGTHEKEKEIWRAAGTAPSGSRYLEAGQGMGEVLLMAAEKRGYALSDRGTQIAARKKTGLAVLYWGDPSLRNPYGVIAVNPARHAHVKGALAARFIAFLTGAQGQALIASFRIDGEQMFFPSAGGAR